ncbi:MAG: hypothetical protein KIT33_10660 [Candidatus Kapabacteria bacterium]|nr:hypothetical protein [Ignavibacteriota bacterium]MCW5885421.1 hypothetical protein [Candidatus Kapabacteria bacterium]
MKTQKNILLLLISYALFAFSCGQNEGNAEINSEASKYKDSRSADTSKDCYSNYIDDICSLISTEKVAEIISISPDEVSRRDNSAIHKSGSPDLISCIFETPGSSKQSSITVGQIKKEDAAIFKTKYNNEYYKENGREAKYLDENLGDAAVCLFVSSNTILTVLVKNESFTVQIYGNPKTHSENTETAIKIAREILKKCQ